MCRTSRGPLCISTLYVYQFSLLHRRGCRIMFLKPCSCRCSRIQGLCIPFSPLNISQPYIRLTLDCVILSLSSSSPGKRWICWMRELTMVTCY
ncbi:uncharacterized protein P174DRAFT_237554 [Aspergillus novofumigatus IBT 16806]|uniref:Uncharacterized protein n=1 Tax=Aspergillus novofumigatus (strain IBT 16806) TaxID=1392255 RepID=A0A2I1C130_ASPN1|nr:uncharacterized protein P174DRAFT_237554 [Aspergillus novofumigatus IBT 16806]PKX91347.1 hypothetical protein P174DRAFT_237554 [Aspergillus novofumigatus IBT 16806]